MKPKASPPTTAKTGAKLTRTRKQAAAQNSWIKRVKQHAALTGKTYKQAMTELSGNK